LLHTIGKFHNAIDRVGLIPSVPALALHYRDFLSIAINIEALQPAFDICFCLPLKLNLPVEFRDGKPVIEWMTKWDLETGVKKSSTK
jgi:hypothetical protein